MRRISVSWLGDLSAGWVYCGDKGSTTQVFRMCIISVMFFMMAGCEKEPDISERKAILTSYVWDNTESCGTVSNETGLYTSIFLPNGTYHTYYKAYVTFTGSWRLIDYFTLSVDNVNAVIAELDHDRLTLKVPGSFFGLFDIECTDKYRSLPITGITSVGVSGLTKTSATLHGYLRTCDDADLSAEYGTSSAYGSSTPMAGNPVHGVSNTVVKVNVSGLMPETTYRYRLKALTSSGVYYGKELTFRTYNGFSLTDANGNEYNTLTIGLQTWMAEPLRTTVYNDGTPIPEVTDSLEWAALESPAYSWYRNNPGGYINVYGALYNWYAVNTGKLCPTGWHVPTEQDITDLTGYLGTKAGDALTQGQYDIEKLMPYLEASNKTGFSAVPTVARYDYGFCEVDCKYWCGSEYDQDNALYLTANNQYAGTSYEVKDAGLPVRCIMDR